MALWEMIPFPYLDETNLCLITPFSMPYNIMQGIDESGRSFLAQKIIYNNELRVGFIIELTPNSNDYEYGVLERLDL